jgi:NADH-quinone oxidoreductase subunit N
MDLSTSLALVRPELVLSFSSLALLLLAAWRNEAGRLVSVLAVAALVGAAVFAGQAFAAGTDAEAFEGLYRSDAFSNFAKILIYFAAAIALMIAPKALEKMGAMRGEYPVLVILSAVGMGVMVSRSISASNCRALPPMF